MTALIVPAGPWRRLAAGFYDLLLLLALWIGIAFGLVLLRQGQAIPPGDPVFRSLLFLVTFGFYGWFWTHGGQTLGMRAWRLQVRRVEDQPIGWLRALVRFVVAVPAWALAGTGILWCLLDSQRRSWQDWASDPCTVVLPAPGADQ